MAGFLGLAAGGVMGAIGAHYRQKNQDEQFYKDLRLKSIINLAHDDPSKAYDERYWKQVQKEGGFSPEHIGALKMYVQSQAGPELIKRKQAQDLMGMIAAASGAPIRPPGGGLVGPTGQQGMINFAPDAQGNLQPAAAVQVPGAASQTIDGAGGATGGAPSPTADIDRRLGLLRSVQLQLAKDPEHAELAKGVEGTIAQLEKDRERALKPGEVSAAEQAKLDVQNLPANVRSRAATQAAIGSARAGAEARAGLAPDIVAARVAEQAQKSAAEAKAKEGKSADPEVEANRRATRFNAMVTSYSKLFPPPTGWTGSRIDAAKPEGKKWLAGLTKYLADHGMGPNGELLSNEPTATGPNGKKMVFRNGEWKPL